MEKKVKTTCLECGTELTLDFSGLSYEEALKAIDTMDHQSRECPGFHVEMGGWKRMWQLEDAVNRIYTDEEKALAKNVEAYIEIWIHGKKKHIVKNEKMLVQFMKGYRETIHEDQPVILKYYNFARELIDEYEDTVYQLSFI